jgi:hypothetical protein
MATALLPVDLLASFTFSSQNTFFCGPFIPSFISERRTVSKTLISRDDGTGEGVDDDVDALDMAVGAAPSPINLAFALIGALTARASSRSPSPRVSVLAFAFRPAVTSGEMTARITAKVRKRRTGCCIAIAPKIRI